MGTLFWFLPNVQEASPTELSSLILFLRVDSFWFLLMLT